VLGFVIAGAGIGLACKDYAIGPFLRLAVSGLILGIIFLAVGLAISIFSRTRVQSLVLALLTWCVAVFVFDLVALGCLISAKAPVAAHEIEVVCDTMHVNAAADIHSEFDNLSDRNPRVAARQTTSSIGWLAANPVDLFRTVNLATNLQYRVPLPAALLSIFLWLGSSLGLGLWKLRRTDL
jgi:ABC-type transport system involved in multi-copper enzyme maturation permease subunit